MKLIERKGKEVSRKKREKQKLSYTEILKNAKYTYYAQTLKNTKYNKLASYFPSKIFRLHNSSCEVSHVQVIRVSIRFSTKL